MKIAVAKEVRADEHRVALVPDVAARLIKAGLEVWVEGGAGERACFADGAYAEVGATVKMDVTQLWREADVVLKVRAPEARDGFHEMDLLRPGTVLIGLLNPLNDPVVLPRLAERQVTAFAMELIPRISRAQSMDVLTSQAVVAGYKAALLGANALGKFFPMLTTAAGTIAPARVLTIGAGVAGLEAIATARRLGAVVEAFDIRPAAKDEVQSLGAIFVEVPLEEEAATTEGYAREVSEAARRREHELLMAHVRRSDVVITTAQVPGKKAPVLVTADMVEAMNPGSVIVDLAAEQGGNCALSEAGKEVVYRGVKILAPINLPSSLPVHASQMYARNISAFLQHLLRDGALHLDFHDLIINSCCVTHDGNIRHERLSNVMGS
jgi:NAD(P) transhydrogenase subunit alpha